jgi:hypothetical protein
VTAHCFLIDWGADRNTLGDFRLGILTDPACCVERSCRLDAFGRESSQRTVPGLPALDGTKRLYQQAVTLVLLGQCRGRWLPVRYGHPSWLRPYTRIVPPSIRRCKMPRVRDLWAPTVVLIGLVGREGQGSQVHNKLGPSERDRGLWNRMSRIIGQTIPPTLVTPGRYF